MSHQKKIEGSEEQAKKNIHKDHRKNMKNKYFESGLNGMAPHNVLELLLFFGIPQKDTNDMAHELIEKFGSFSGVLQAEKSKLLTVKGMTENAACLITMILPLYKFYIQDLQKKRVMLKTSEEFAAYFKPMFVDTINERAYVLCLDAKDRVIACKELSEGDFSAVNVDLRKLSSILLETQAKKAVICHNHPHGITRPSRADVATTKGAAQLLRLMKVQLVDHIIVGETSYFAMSRAVEYAHIFYDEQINISNL